MTGAQEAVISRVTSVRRCVAQARTYRAAAGDAFDGDLMRQDAAILNIIRACDLCLDLANLWIRREQLGIPQESRDSFRLLQKASLLSNELGERLQKMVGFRNLAVHQYYELNFAIVRAIIERDLDDALAFADLVRVAFKPTELPHA